MPWAGEVAPFAYRALGFIESRGGTVLVVDEERTAFRDLAISEVVLDLQPTAARRIAIREYLDAPELLKRDIYRLAGFISGRVEGSETLNLRRNPERNSRPPNPPTSIAVPPIPRATEKMRALWIRDDSSRAEQNSPDVRRPY